MSWTTDPPALRPLMPRPPKLINSWSDYGREMPLVSSRWNPTPEQVQALEEMYRRGTRTPSAEQIQQIAAKLRRFGKIEGKNVFYWFQNHKARDRQKKRRQLELFAAKDNHTTKQSGLSRKYLEMEQPKKVATMSKCSTASKYYGGEMEECKAQTDSRETPLELSSPNKNIISQENGRNTLIALKLLPQKTHDFKHGMGENPTLELFPVNGSGGLKKEEMDDVYVSTKLVPNQFFEFLPTKN